MLRGKGHHTPEFPYDLVRIFSLQLCIHPIEYNVVGDTKAPSVRYFSFISSLKAGDIETTGKYMDYQTIRNLQFRQLLKNFP